MKIYGCDVLGENASNVLTSNVIFFKLPLPFKQELARKLGTNYPSISQIFDNYVDVITTLNLKAAKSPEISQCPRTSAASSESKPQSDDKRVFSNPAVAHAERKACKFCFSQGHSMINCTAYPTYQSRKDRCSELKICFKCSSPKHTGGSCNNVMQYECKYCKTKTHISALCSRAHVSQTQSNLCLNSASDSRSGYILPTITLPVSKGNKVVRARFLIDTGSQRTYVSGNVLRKLEFPSDLKVTRYRVNTFLEQGVKHFAEVSLNFGFLDGSGDLLVPVLVDEKFNMSFEVPSLSLAAQNLKLDHKLADSSFDECSDLVNLDGILGVDVVQCFRNFQLSFVGKGSVFAYNDKIIPFGNVEHFLNRKQALQMYESLHRSNSEFQSTVNFVLNPEPYQPDAVNSVISDSEVEGKLGRMFQIESIGLSDESICEADARKVDEIESNIQLIDGKYHVPLLWNELVDKVPNNFALSRAVLTRVVQRLKSKGLLEQYNAVFEQQLSDGVLEEVPISSLNSSNQIFIPHREVVRTDPTCTTKVRPVLNCSAKIGRNPSLNDAAFPGIDLMGNLFNLLVNLRHDRYVVVSDIRKAFLQIKLLSEDDRNKFCILWEREGHLVAYRYTTIVFGFVASPFVLNYVIKHHLKQFPADQCSHFLQNSLYVDNLFITANDASTLKDLSQTALTRMEAGGFELRSWATNCPELQQAFEEQGIAAEHGESTEKVLGYRYCRETDQLFIAMPSDDFAEKVTKRDVLSKLAKCYDPLGFLSPITVNGKNFMRELWKAQVGWDDELSESLLATWSHVNANLNEVHKFKFNRQALTTESPVELIIFTDASQSNYGFAIYARTIVNETIKCNILFSKTKVAPLKSKTLPTLELLAVFLAMKCLMNILPTLQRTNVTEIILATDSQIVLSWILNERVKSKNVFASNRVGDILNLKRLVKSEHALDCKFKFINSDCNPADLLTRGLTIKEFNKKKSFWLHGPEFLQTSHVQWPKNELACIALNNQCLISCASLGPRSVCSVFDSGRFSSLDKMLGVTARLFFVAGLARHVKLTRLQCLSRAKEYWLKVEQRAEYQKELEFLSKPEHRSVPPLVRDLNLFKDDQGVIRSKGRLRRCAHLPYDVIHPVLLARNGNLTNLIIRKCHEKCKHMGISSTLNMLRNQGFWLPRARPKIKQILKQCVLCSKFNSFAFRYPKPTDFHKDKVNLLRPFENVGVDFTGHFFIKFGETTVKMYLLIFTCLNVRAIHLEIVPDMSTDSFLAAFVRFTNRFGFPVTLYSDNAPSFTQAAKFLNKSFSDDHVTEVMSRNNIKHVQIPLYSAWFGSSWERLIRVVKSCLFKSIGKSKMEYFRFLTLLTDIQEAVNSRPLTYRDTSNTDHEIISPNSFLKITPSSNLMFGSVTGEEVVKPSSKDLIKSLEIREDALDKFKDLWYSEYLLSLREVKTDCFQPQWEDKIKVNDIVLISSPTKPRPLWTMGRITKLFTGSDGRTRSVELIRPDRSTGEYAVSLLYPLELNLDQVVGFTSHASNVPINSNDVSDTIDIQRRPVRAAARQCLLRLRESQ